MAPEVSVSDEVESQVLRLEEVHRSTTCRKCYCVAGRNDALEFYALFVDNG